MLRALRKRVSATKFGYQRFGQIGAPQPRRVLAGSARCIVEDSVARRATEDLFIPIKVRPDIGAAMATRLTDELGLQIRRPDVS